MTSSHFSKGKRGPMISPKGKTRITIFIDTDILEWFGDEAEGEGRFSNLKAWGRSFSGSVPPRVNTI